MPLEAALQYPDALDIVRTRVKPTRDTNNRAAYRHYWWQFAEARREMRTALHGMRRFVVSVAQGKRLLLAWEGEWTCPSNLTNVFVFEDDYAMGILASSTHGAWAWSRGSTLKGDLRYTPSSVFETFPWPCPATDTQRERVAEASRRVVGRRQEICGENNIGLTALYNLVDEGAYADLKAHHDELDEAVVAAYAWPKAIAHNDSEIVQRLLGLNREIAAGTRRYDPFGAQAAVAATQLPIAD